MGQINFFFNLKKSFIVSITQKPSKIQFRNVLSRYIKSIPRITLRRTPRPATSPQGGSKIFLLVV